MWLGCIDYLAYCNDGETRSVENPSLRLNGLQEPTSTSTGRHLAKDGLRGSEK